MQFQLINPPNPEYSAMEQIFFNRGIDPSRFRYYANLNDNCICDYTDFDESLLERGVKILINAIKNNKKAVIIVDCDCDGYTSAALLINYLHETFESWVENKLDWLMHSGKSHGLAEHFEMIKESDYDLIICPDSSSNDYEYHRQLTEFGKNILVLDHHLADQVSPYAVVINNQLSNYPNKEFSGVGVVWQFCRYIDKLLGANYADNYLDLVALGNCGDMMSLLSFETRYLIFKGFQEENIKNPFVEYMISKNNFPLSKADYKSYQRGQALTSIGAAFFVVPFVNAVTRSGTAEEKQLCFESMINHLAFKNIPSTKRGHKAGETEMLVLQSVRTIGNVKNRQTKSEERGLGMLEARIAADNMLEHKILLFLLEPGEIEAEIRGLVANKLMAKYQRPVAVLTHREDVGTYEGSMRGYTKNGLTSFKDLLKECSGVIYVEGHDNAAGLGIQADEVERFLNDVDEKMSHLASEPVYRIDYAFDNSNLDPEKIADIGRMNDYWGQDFERAYVSVRFKITDSNFAVMKGNTLKFTLPKEVTMIKFDGSEDEIAKFTTEGYVEVEAYCKCVINEWNGYEYPQLIMESYEILDSCQYYF